MHKQEHALKAYEGVTVELHAVATWALHGYDCSAHALVA
jgi:hypothetical protein